MKTSTNKMARNARTWFGQPRNRPPQRHTTPNCALRLFFPVTISYLASTAGAIFLPALQARAQPEFIDLGALPQGNGSSAVALSTDASIAAGSGTAPTRLAMRWTAEGGMRSLGFLEGGYTSGATGMSADGTIVVGLANSYSTNVAFRWTEHEGMQRLGSLPGVQDGVAYGVSADGSVIVGKSAIWPVRWIDGGQPQRLGELLSFPQSYALGVSADGMVAVGFACSSASCRAVRWLADGTVQDLGINANNATASAYAASADGRVVTGKYRIGAQGFHAFRWTESEGAVDLGVPTGGISSEGLAINGDGSIVVGTSYVNGYRAAIWTRSSGMLDLNTYLRAQGVSLAGWSLDHAFAITPDGTAVAGSAFHNGTTYGWIVRGVRLPSCIADMDDGSGSGTPDGAVTIDDLLYYLNQYADGVLRADVDDGTSTGTPDGGVTIDDLLYYLFRFEAGC